MKTSQEYRTLARTKLQNNWGPAILVCLIVVGVSAFMNFIPLVGGIIALLISGQLMVGEMIYFSKLVKNENPVVGTIFTDFSKNLTSNFITYLLYNLYIILWTLLFIVPGIIKSYSYSMTFYLKSKNPQLSASEAITISKNIMNGKKWSLACLHFSFVGWFLLSILTLGVGFVFLIPYMQTATVEFYEQCYNSYLTKEALTTSINEIENIDNSSSTEKTTHQNENN